jgi:hypothetical protein
MVMVVAVCAAVVLAQAPLPPKPAAPAALDGVWTLNKDLSDKPTGGDRAEQGDRGTRNGGYGGGGRGGGYGGGRGGRMRGGGGGGGGNMPPRNPEETARMRDAMRDVTDPSERLTIVQTDSMVLITGADGRTTRLSADGKKIKDENTGVERKTKWDGGKLVSEISGLGSGKMTQTFAVDPESHQLRVSVQMEGGRSREPRTITHIYDKSTTN